MGIRAVWLILFYSLLMPVAIAADVKQSKAGICHVSGSTYYSRVKHYTAYANLGACLRAGGRLPADSNVTVAPVAQAPSSTLPRSTLPAHNLQHYSRDNFGRGWADSDRDCQNSRHEALAAQSTAPVRYKNPGRCQVVAGRWISVFSGRVIHNAADIDIDHLVPLKWAWEHGAASWTKAERVRFANDPVNLLSVEASLNRQKGAKGLDKWLPPTNQCQYVARFLRVIRSYKFTLSHAEEKKYQAIRVEVCGR